MPTQSTALPFTALALDRSSATPLHRQLYDWLREAILSSRIPAVRAYQPLAPSPPS